ncbi:MAG TPA: hypothetical protein VGM83_05285 [Devosiaceae bacterium]|jgi:hypothetical protein
MDLAVSNWIARLFCKRNLFMVALALAPIGTTSAAMAAQGAVGINDQPAELRAVSKVSDLKFTLLAKLPSAPPSGRETSGCENFVISPTSSAGKLVADQGWSVTGEAPLGDDEAVSFAAVFEQGTSGTCAIQQGNVAIFHDETLLAIAYAPHPTDETIGSIASLEGGNVRVWSGDLLSTPVADLELLDGGYLLQLGDVAAEETLCGGKAVVPNIYGTGIDKARAKLAASGWQPVLNITETGGDQYGREIDLAKHGITEVNTCSGTGLGYCDFNYVGKAGKLNVSTVGEDDFPVVAGYAVDCN